MRDMIVRCATVILMIGAICFYNQQTKLHLNADAIAKAKVDAQNEEIEAQNREILAAQAASGEVEALYTPGTYEGAAQGFGGEIQVAVTVDEFSIISIEILSANGEDGAYFATAKAIVDDILEAQSSGVDTISGATFSSTGIKNAVTLALQEAKNK
ncbi:MAG: FMN-binding protein [Lachnospiraceae bacterium]|nr:FMN-binding protein [Lachnospiraceae bacterium]